MKKKLLVLATLVLTLLTGCSDKNQEPKNKKVEISYSIWAMEQEPTVKKLIAKFEKENPNIKVRLEVTPWEQYWTKLEAAITGGIAPDVFSMGQESQLKYMEAGIPESLNSYIEKDNVDMNQYVDSVKFAYKKDEQYYAMPRDVDSIALAYNKNIFDAAGVPYPTNDWTWDNMVNAGKIISIKLKDVYPITLELYGQNSYYNTIPQSGGYVIDSNGKKSGYNKKGTIEGIKRISDLIKDGLMPSAEELSDMDCISLFQSNKVAMFYAGAWNVKDFSENELLKGNIGFVVMPLIKERAAVSNGIGLMMSSKSKHKDAAWKLIKFLTSEESQKYLASTGTVIPAYKAVEHFWADGFREKINVDAFIDELEYIIPFPTSLEGSKWRDQENEILNDVWTGKITPEEASENIYKVMNEVLKEEYK